MTRRFASRRTPDRERSGAIDIDAALEAYLNGGDAEALLRAAVLVLGSNILDEKLAETIADLTTAICEDYDDAGRAVRSDGRTRREALMRRGQVSRGSSQALG
jgi:hypothetical protein